MKAIVAALPREIAALVKGWKKTEPRANVFVYAQDDVIVACAGMGAARVTLAVQAALTYGTVTELISAGLAGACDPTLRVGDIVRGEKVVDSRTGERFGQTGEAVVTAVAIASVAEKRRLWQAYAAGAVDMEAATVARLARANGLEFRAVKAISDEAGFELAGLGEFATADGQFREAAFAFYALMRPWIWGKLFLLARNGNRALRSLTSALEAEFTDKRYDKG